MGDGDNSRPKRKRMDKQENIRVSIKEFISILLNQIQQGILEFSELLTLKNQKLGRLSRLLLRQPLELVLQKYKVQMPKILRKQILLKKVIWRKLLHLNQWKNQSLNQQLQKRKNRTSLWSTTATSWKV
jgi:hypothetical protein